jgi:hypothetical protein
MSSVREALLNLKRLVGGRRYPHLEQYLQDADRAVAEDLFRLARDIQGELNQARQSGARKPWRR